MTFIEREFAGETRRFQLCKANSLRLYRGIESEGIGNLSELARRATTGLLGDRDVERILVHALSRGHPITLLRMQDVVRDEMSDKPLAAFLSLVMEIISISYAGSEQ